MASISGKSGPIGSGSRTFIIRCGETCYVTQSVVRYDPASAKSPEEKADVAGVRALFEETKAGGGVCEAVQLPEQHNAMSFQHASDDD